MSDFYRDSAERRLQQLSANRAANLADLEAHKLNGDHDAAGECIQNLANIDAEKANLTQLYQSYVQSQQGPHRPWVSEEARAGRRPEEMDQQDLADIMNQSKYPGKGFTAQDYDNLRRGLGGYKAARGIESK
jgi:hypothetical protein